MNRRTEYTGRFEAKRPVREKVRRVSAGAAVLLILLIFFARLGTEAFRVLGCYDLFLSGRDLLLNRNATSVDIADSLTSKDGETIPVYRLDDGKTIIYKGHTYHLNEDLVTVLFLGIDREISEEDTVAGEGGQCDVVMLMGMDTKTGEATVLNISRETYAQVEIFSSNGHYIETQYQQIALSYAYGNGKDTSCENAVRSVSSLLYGLPVSSCVAIDMEGIQAANEAVGGVKLTSLVDYKGPDGITFVKGKTYELHGAELDRYIRLRAHTMEGNENRMRREKQWITEFCDLVVTRSIRNITFPVKLFSSLSPYMSTTLTVPNVTFLSSCFLRNGARFEFRNIDGTYDILNGSAVFYPDEVDLFEAILQVFYLQVD